MTKHKYICRYCKTKNTNRAYIEIFGRLNTAIFYKFVQFVLIHVKVSTKEFLIDSLHSKYLKYFHRSPSSVNSINEIITLNMTIVKVQTINVCCINKINTKINDEVTDFKNKCI